MRKDEHNVLSFLSKTKDLQPDRSPCVLTASDVDKNFWLQSFASSHNL